jgi:hypothetical protein
MSKPNPSGRLEYALAQPNIEIWNVQVYNSAKGLFIIISLICAGLIMGIGYGIFAEHRYQCYELTIGDGNNITLMKTQGNVPEGTLGIPIFTAYKVMSNYNIIEGPGLTPMFGATFYLADEPVGYIYHHHPVPWVGRMIWGFDIALCVGIVAMLLATINLSDQMSRKHLYDYCENQYFRNLNIRG